jgi:hypothetical protein
MEAVRRSIASIGQDGWRVSDMADRDIPAGVAAPERATLRLGAIAGILGIAAQIWLSGLHAGRTDPNLSPQVFLEYAASGSWTLVHIGQYVGTFLIVLALVVLFRSMRRETGPAAAFATVGIVAATMVLAVFAVQMAVDGVALRETIAAWVTAPEIQKPAAFYVADGVRWIEKGLSAFFHLNNGTTLVALGLAVALGTTYARWLGVVGVAAGVAIIAGGVVAAQTGFSPEAAQILGPASIGAAVFLVGICISMWRHAGRRPAAVQPTASLVAAGA